jgi:small-conductance mechanosensitive channel
MGFGDYLSGKELPDDIFKEDRMNVHKIAIILVHAFIGWMLCFATIGIGRAVTTMEITLIVHAILAPIFFAIVSLVYFHKFNFTTPLQTAIIFISFVVVMDVFVVAMLINRSFEMFTSLLGTWLPFALIFFSTYLTGILVTHTGQRRTT